MQLGTYQNLEQQLDLTQQAITNTLNDPRGRWILNKEHNESRSEYAVTLQTETGPKHQIIDRTFIADGVRWIIDYKTSAPHNQLYIQNFLKEQAQIYYPQLEKYALAMRHQETSIPIRCALYFPCCLLGMRSTFACRMNKFLL